MRRQTTATIALLLALHLPAAAADSPDTQKSTGSKGITVDDLGRGLKSAAQNIEKEIPKIGSAIGETFKKITDKSATKKPPPDPTNEKK